MRCFGAGPTLGPSDPQTHGPSDPCSFKNQSVPGDFTFVDLQAPLGHVAHALLALLAAVHGQVVDVRSLVCHFEVTDAAVALRGTSQSVRLFEGACMGHNDGSVLKLTLPQR